MDNAHGRWFGSLELRFDAVRDQTVLRSSRHVGPLRVQRPFREPDGGCQVYVLNPPGGVVGGDELRLYADAAPGSRALLTLPGAGKFYRSAGPTARALQHLKVASGARLEWLPQETIVFDGAIAEATTRVELQPGARFAGWEITCLGRPASGERFTTGQWRQRFELWLGDEPLWLEQVQLRGGDPLIDEPWGLRSQPVFGSFALFPATRQLVDHTHEALERARVNPEHVGTTLLEHPTADGTLVCRYLGDSTLQARRTFEAVWQTLRPTALGSMALSPRVWAT